MAAIDVVNSILPDITTLNTLSPVSWQTAFWLIITLATNTMAQPCGRILGQGNTNSRFFIRILPMICAVDMLSVIFHLIIQPLFLKTSWQEARRAILRSRYQKTNINVRIDDVRDLVNTSGTRWVLFFLTGLLPAVKLAVLRGVPGTQALGFIYFGSFLVMELFILFCTSEDIDSIPEYPSPPATNTSTTSVIDSIPERPSLPATNTSTASAIDSIPKHPSPPARKISTAFVIKAILPFLAPLLVGWLLQLLHFIWFILYLPPFNLFHTIPRSHRASKSSEMVLDNARQLFFMRFYLVTPEKRMTWRWMIYQTIFIIFIELTFVWGLLRSVAKNLDTIDLSTVYINIGIVTSLFVVWLQKQKTIFGFSTQGWRDTETEFHNFVSYLLALIWWYAFEYNPEGTVNPSWTGMFG